MPDIQEIFHDLLSISAWKNIGMDLQQCRFNPLQGPGLTQFGGYPTPPFRYTPIKIKKYDQTLYKDVHDITVK